jgi:Uma2 family endonuclease
MSIHEIVLPETKPETEWVRGRALQKTGGTYNHGAAQGKFAWLLHMWANAQHGRVAPSWRFRVAPLGAIIRPLAPDVAYLSYEAVAADAPSTAVDVPLGAPTVAVEVLSEDDLALDIEDKIATYLAAGTAAVVVVNPEAESMSIYNAHRVRRLRAGETFTDSALPGFALDVAALFERARR